MRKVLNQNPFILYAVLFSAFVLSGCATGGGGPYLDETYSAAKNNYEQGAYEQAAQYYQQFVQENPQSRLHEISLFYLADSYHKTGRDDLAIATYQKLIDEYKSGFWVETAQQEIQDINGSQEKPGQPEE